MPKKGSVLPYRNMAVAWISVAILAIASLVWIRIAGVTFIPTPTVWSALIAACLVAFVWPLRWISRRAVKRKAPLARFIAFTGQRLALFCSGFAFAAALKFTLVVATYLVVASPMPLQDRALASIDAALGFHWPQAAELFNQNKTVASILAWSYISGLPQLWLLVIFFSATNREERLGETCALVSLTALVGVAVAALVPASGPVHYFSYPVDALTRNYGVIASHVHLDLFHRLRGGAALVIDDPQGVICFPSFHTFWAVIMIYALRGMGLLTILATTVNVLVLIATIPKGGHYLIDTIVGIAIAVFCIVAYRATHGN